MYERKRNNQQNNKTKETEIQLVKTKNSIKT